MADDFAVAPDVLAADATHLLAKGATGTAGVNTERAADRVHWLICRQLDDLDKSSVLASFDNDPEDSRTRAELASTLVDAIRYDPDFARQLLTAVNSDCATEQRPTVVSLTTLTLTFAPLLRVGLGILVLAAGIWLRHRYGPIQSECRTGIGSLARATNANVSAQCDLADTGAPAGWWIIAAGIVLIAEGVGRLIRHMRPSADPQLPSDL